MRTRLEALAGQDLPFRVPDGRQADDLVISWNTVDAAWVGLMFQAGRRRRVDRMILRFDAEAAVVRSVDTVYEGRLVGSGADGRVALGGSASYFRGIVFEAVEIGAIPGVVWRGDAASAAPGYAWRFDRGELKRAVATIVAEGGWSLRPVVTFNRLLNG